MCALHATAWVVASLVTRPRGLATDALAVLLGVYVSTTSIWLSLTPVRGSGGPFRAQPTQSEGGPDTQSKDAEATS